VTVAEPRPLRRYTASASGVWPVGALDHRYGHICPECAGPKSRQAVRCWNCRRDKQRREKSRG